MAQAGACLILVLGWSLTSAADDGVWIEDAGSGCALWNDHPHETVATDWSGPCEDGKASGRGAFTWRVLREGVEITETYEGHFLAGRLAGEGLYKDTRGEVYEGEWIDGVTQGEGRLTTAGGDLYVGQWKAGRRHGEGVQTWRSGSRYQGSWEEDNMHGLGAMIWWNGESFEGEFINDLGHGIGVCRTEEGAMAACEFTTGAFTRWVE
jgi:hypothetical protein